MYIIFFLTTSQGSDRIGIVLHFFLFQQYLTSKLAGVLVQTETSTPLQDSSAPDVKSEDEINVKSEDEMDDLFENMDTIE